ncbi:MAG: DUF456 family protein [Elusimicrobia bacterium]|nr:DUF456 family protein [Elusimicrobiota bacterium]
MEIAAFILLTFTSLAGFALIFFTNFGTTVIMVGCIIFAIMTGFEIIPIPYLLVLIILYLFGELIEYICIIIGAKKFGASNKAIFGAIIGGIVGAVLGSLFFGIGVFFGTLAGIFIGAFIIELAQKKTLWQSARAGTGGIIGRMGAIVGKVIIALIMFLILIINIIQYY